MTKSEVPKSRTIPAALRGGARAGAGRPRRPGVEQAVADATLGLLANRSYVELTVDAIAEGAGVARTTIYRRWPSKAAVVAAAVSSLYLDRVELPDTGSVADDLVTLLTESYRLMVDGSGRVLERLIRESGQNPELVEVVSTTYYARRRLYTTLLNRGIARGELSAEVDQELLLDLLLGPLWFRLLVTGAPITDDAAAAVVATVFAVRSTVRAGPHGPPGSGVADHGTDEATEATFAFVDLAGFTAMTEAHGDAQAVSMIRAFRERAIDVLGHDDELVKTIGDAVMLRFASPEGAVVALRRLLEQELFLQETLLLPRAGAHHGSAVAIEGDYYGAAVNLAARVAGQARGGQLLVTERTAIAARETGATITHVGCLELRNVSEAVDIFDVRVTDETGSTVTDPVCQMRVPKTGDSAVILEWSGRHLYFCGLPCVARFAADPETYLRRLPDPQ